MKNRVYNKQEEIANRVFRAVELFMEDPVATVRTVAIALGVSKSTIHIDLTRRLLELDKKVYEEVQDKLLNNKEERYLRGGIATKKRWAGIKDT